MKVTLTALPKLLSSFSVKAEKIVADKEAFEYALRMKEFIFGKEAIKTCELLEMDIFTLAFIKGMTFREYITKKLKNIPEDKKEGVMLGFMINALYKGKPVMIIPVKRNRSSLTMGEPSLLRLSIIDTSADYKKKNNHLIKKAEKNSKKDYEITKSGHRALETIQIAAVKYYMKNAINDKEFMDKVNYRRFSTGLRLNNRPADIEDINALLRKRKNLTFIDLTDTSARLYLSALYLVIENDISLYELYNSEKVFSPESDDNDIYSQSASKFINIIYNGNGIEISDILVKMAEKFSKIEIPVFTPGNLSELIENFNIIYAVAAIAHKFDKAFNEHEMLKTNMRRRMIDSYWTVYCNIIQFKKFGSVVAFCYLLANLDLNKYRDDISYSEEVMNEFAEAEKAIKEINKEVHGV
ncbi:MAG: hypothetical protein IJ416_05285 [Ruminiclostridium sp.]|nr:hypothetical protein [Ruminiclostridium sp.]